MPFGELAFIQPMESSTHPGMNKRCCWLDDDADLVVVAVDEPVEGHGEHPLNHSLMSTIVAPCKARPVEGDCHGPVRP